MGTIKLTKKVGDALDWFYIGSLALASMLTLQLSDRRHWVIGHLGIVAVVGLLIAAYRTFSAQADPLWQLMIVGLKILAYGLLPLVTLIVAISFVRYSYRLIRKEGWHFHYSLLAIVGILLIGMLTLAALNFSSWQDERLWQLLGLAFLLTAFFVFSFLAYLVACVTTRLGWRHQLDAIIVLGAGLMPDGRPTRSLSYRLKAAAKLYHRQRTKYHQRLIIVVSGGQGADEVVAESTAMRRYLMAIGVPRDAILEENQSTTTRENLIFSHRLLVQRQPLYRAVFVTNGYHVLRANIFARQLHLNLTGIGARTPVYYLPFAMFREYLALIVMYRWTNFIAVIVLTGLYGWLLVR